MPFPLLENIIYSHTRTCDVIKRSGTPVAITESQLMKSAVFALASSSTQAAAIIDELRLSGFSRNAVSVLFRDIEGTGEYAHAKATKAPEGILTVAGAEEDGVLGIMGWIMGLGTLAIPGAAPVIAAGPIFVALGSATIGVEAGGLTEALVDLGLPEYEARHYADKLQDGNILIAAHIENIHEVNVARGIFERTEASDIGITDEMAVHA